MKGLMHIVCAKARRKPVTENRISKRGENIMNPAVEQDIRKLMVDTEDLKRALDMLEQDHAAWARTREEKDLLKIIEHLKALEFDVSMMMSDCFSLTYHEGAGGLNQDLDRAFGRLNVLFGDLKKIRAQLNSSYIHRGELRQLEIDWGRFRKTIGQIRKDLQDAERSPESEKKGIIH
jgi:hypothetical protein